MTEHETVARLEALEALTVTLVAVLKQAGRLGDRDRDRLRDALQHGAKADPVRADAARSLGKRI